MNNEIEKRLWAKVERYLCVLQMVPFVKMVAVCNNLAFGKAGSQSDIDLFVVADVGRLFFVRTFVTGLLHFLGVRRHGSKIAGRFCLSFFIDEEAADLSKIAINDDIYLAYWIRSMKPVIDYNYSDDFKMQNTWVGKFFEDSKGFFFDKSRILPINDLNAFLKNIFLFIFSGWLGDFFEKIFSVWQKKRASKKVSRLLGDHGLVLNDHMLKFHNNDSRASYRDKWRSKYGSDKLTDDKFLGL